MTETGPLASAGITTAVDGIPVEGNPAVTLPAVSIFNPTYPPSSGPLKRIIPGPTNGICGTGNIGSTGKEMGKKALVPLWYSMLVQLNPESRGTVLTTNAVSLDVRVRLSPG